VLANEPIAIAAMSLGGILKNKRKQASIGFYVDYYYYPKNLRE